MKNFENQIAQLCYNKYNSLKNSGKPRENEWTVLSGIILSNSANELSVVSLCTGTKCLSGNELMDNSLWKKGSRLSDSHAEILARRSFLRYLYYQISLVQNKLDSEVFMMTNEGEITLIENTTFHFFSSQSPCGDCSIIPKTKNNVESERPYKISKIDDSVDSNQVDDIHRTGAKCLSTEKLRDTYESGNKYHVVGPLRTKPGRGERTLSLSCSDKIAKWIITGLQGSLLSLIVPTIRLNSIIIGGECPFSMNAMERGLFKRFNHDFSVPQIFQSNIPFPCIKNKTRTQPCPSSIIWCKVPNRDTEIAVEGRKQGATKKMKKGSYLLITRIALLESFLRICENSTQFQNIRHPKKLTYYHCKQASKKYQQLWNRVRKDVFLTWPLKQNNLQDFIL